MPAWNASGRPFAAPLRACIRSSPVPSSGDVWLSTSHGNTDAIMAETLTATSEDREILGRAPVRELLDRIRDAVRVTDAGAVELVDETALRERSITTLAHASALHADPDVRDTARWIIGKVGDRLGIRP